MRHRRSPFASGMAPANRQTEEIETSVSVGEDRHVHWHAAPLERARRRLRKCAGGCTRQRVFLRRIPTQQLSGSRMLHGCSACLCTLHGDILLHEWYSGSEVHWEAE